jgi:hypothetical protein
MSHLQYPLSTAQILQLPETLIEANLRISRAGPVGEFHMFRTGITGSFEECVKVLGCVGGPKEFI